MKGNELKCLKLRPARQDFGSVPKTGIARPVQAKSGGT
jgi:hypothetical protein